MKHLQVAKKLKSIYGPNVNYIIKQDSFKDCDVTFYTDANNIIGINDAEGITVHNHTYDKVEDVPATCGNIGYSLYRCSCGQERIDNEVEETNNHNYYIAEIVDSNDQECGYKLFKCDDCGSAYTEEIPIKDLSTDPTVINVRNELQILGFQISTTLVDSKGQVGGIRTVGKFPKKYNEVKTSECGYIYCLEEYKGQKFEVNDNEMYVNCENPYVATFESTQNGILDIKMSDSDDYSYYARTMLFGGATRDVLNAKYKIRSYEVLEDGTYIYSDIKSFSIYDVANLLYSHILMPTKTQHDFLYNNILTTVEPSFVEKDYMWSNVIVPPDAVE